jgi:hypothetical protein
VYLKPFQVKATAPLSAFSLLLAFSPEVLAVVSCIKSRQWDARVKQQKLQQPPSTGVTSFRFSVDKVGCISCVSTLKSALRSNPKLPELVGCEVKVGDEGGLTVDIMGDQETAGFRTIIEATVTDAGFQCQFIDCCQKELPQEIESKKFDAEETSLSGVIFGAWQSIALGLLSSSCCGGFINYFLVLSAFVLVFVF